MTRVRNDLFDGRQRQARGCSKLSEDSRREMAGNERTLVETKFCWPEIAREIHAVYEWILGQGPRPKSVRLN